MSLKKNALLFAIIGMMLCALVPMHTKADSKMDKVAIVYFKDYIDKSLLERNTDKIIYEFSEIPAATVQLTDAQFNNLSHNTKVNKVEIDKPVSTSSQVISWGYKAVNMEARKPSSVSGKGVKIGILDTGVEPNHPDLKITGGVCVLNNFSPDDCKDGYTDDNGHGTHVAGIIGAQNNDFGVVGVAPDSKIYAIKALGHDGEGSASTVMAGIEWAIKNHMDILNLSLATPFKDSGLEAMINEAYKSGVLIVAAAGNEGPSDDGSSSVQYPAKFANAIAVSSIHSDSSVSSTSSVGVEVELSAPGDLIYSTVPTSINSKGYMYMSGTSMAAPFVTGIAALYKEKYPNDTNVQIRQKLRSNAKDLGATGRDALFGYGLVQADTLDIKQLDVPYNVDAKGKVEIDLSSVIKDNPTYNIYRFDKLIGKNKTDSQIVDYGLNGAIDYTLVPILNGQEQVESSIHFEVDNHEAAFQDLSNMEWYSRYMMYLYGKGILNGYNDHTVRSKTTITRGEAAAMIGEALKYDGTPRSTRFKDTTSEVFSSGYIEALAEHKIIQGFPDGTFRPKEPVTRAEMAILIGKAYNLTITNSNQFSDINKNVTGYQYINSLATSHISTGFQDGTFRPNNLITRADYSVFLAKADNDLLR